jgi:hypothetical protein
MGMIPTPIYRITEKRLRQRDKLAEAAARTAEARERAADPRVAEPDRAPGPRRVGGENPRLEAVIEAGDAEELARRWLRVFERVDKAFPPETNTGRVAWLMYREGLTQEETCRKLGRDRQYVRRQRDIYVCHCAILAAAAGLIHLRNTQEAKP